MDVKIDGKKVAEFKPKALVRWENEVERVKLTIEEYEFLLVKERLWLKTAEKELTAAKKSS